MMLIRGDLLCKKTQQKMLCTLNEIKKNNNNKNILK